MVRVAWNILRGAVEASTEIVTVGGAAAKATTDSAQMQINPRTRASLMRGVLYTNRMNPFGRLKTIAARPRGSTGECFCRGLSLECPDFCLRFVISKILKRRGRKDNPEVAEKTAQSASGRCRFRFS